MKISTSKAEQEIDMTVLFGTGSSKSNLIDEEKLKRKKWPAKIPEVNFNDEKKKRETKMS